MGIEPLVRSSRNGSEFALVNKPRCPTLRSVELEMLAKPEMSLRVSGVVL